MVEKWRQARLEETIKIDSGLTIKNNKMVRNEFLIRLACGYYFSIKSLEHRTKKRLGHNIILALKKYHKYYNGKDKVTITDDQFNEDSAVNYIRTAIRNLERKYHDNCNATRCNSRNPTDTEIGSRLYIMKDILKDVLKDHLKPDKLKLTDHTWDFFDPDNYEDIDPPKK